MLSYKNETFTIKNIFKTVSSIVFITGFSFLVMFPTKFYEAKTEPVQVSSNFIEGLQTPANVISLEAIVPTVEQDIDESVDTVFSYKVKPGDNLSSIAKMFNTTVSILTETNNLSPNSLLRVGQNLHISSTPGTVITLKESTNPMVFTNKYNLSLEDFMDVNGLNDPLHPYEVGQEIFIPDSREKLIEVGLLDKPSPSSFNIYTVKPKPKPKPKPVVTKPTTTQTIQTANRDDKPGQPYRYGSNTYKQPHIIAQWRENRGVYNRFAKGFCTYHSAIISPWLFPFIDEKTQRRPFGGNANKWIQGAVNAGYKTSKVPTKGAIMVIAHGGPNYRSAGHVGVVLEVDWANNRILVEDMNYKGRFVVTQRWIYLDPTMVYAVANSQPILGYIPVQPLRPEHQAIVDAERQKRGYQP